jgi:amino acid transporter
MPRAIVISILGVAAIYLVMNIGIMGVIPWRKAIDSTNIGTDAVQAVWGHVGGVIITLLIVLTAFASVYCGLLGGSRLPYNAARDHLFFSPFGRLHPRLRFPHVSLLVMGVVTAIASLFSLTTIIDALVSVSIIVQFIGGIGALVILRRRQPELRRPYRQWLYPVPCIIALVGWIYTFVSSGRSAIELALVWMVLGVVAYLIWSYYEKVWPFGPKEIREAFVEEQRASARPG